MDKLLKKDGRYLLSDSEIKALLLDCYGKAEFRRTDAEQVDICVMGDGAIYDRQITKSLEKEFGTHYFINILKLAYEGRVCEPYLRLFKGVIKDSDLLIKDNQITVLMNNERNNHEPSNEFVCQIYKLIDRLNKLVEALESSKYYSDQDIHDLTCQVINLAYAPDFLKYHNLYSDNMRGFVFNIDLFKHIPKLIELRIGYNKLVKDLAQHIKNAESKLCEFPDVIHDIGNTWFFSLNWCDSYQTGNINNMIKLHGTCQNHHSMILPTQELIHNSVLQRSCLFDIAVHLLKRCCRLYLWGVSLTDYDVEIQYLIFNHFNHDGEIYVINPDKTVYERVKLLSSAYSKNNNVTHITVNE